VQLLTLSVITNASIQVGPAPTISVVQVQGTVPELIGQHSVPQSVVSVGQLGHCVGSVGHGGTQRFFREPSQQPATRTHTSSPGQSRFLSHSSVVGHSFPVKSRHLLRPLTVLAHWQFGQLPQRDSSPGHLLLLMGGTPSHGPSSSARQRPESTRTALYYPVEPHH
jgi:hypothetical protein